MNGESRGLMAAIHDVKDSSNLKLNIIYCIHEMTDMKG